MALLNDCKYGYDIHDNVMRLSLLKSATSPDRDADQGEHRMTYSLLPHVGDWRAAVEAAYDLNEPIILRRVYDGKAPETKTITPLRSLVRAYAPSLIIETVKQAEDGRGIIVRLYEHQRTRGKSKLSVGFTLAEAYICNLLEEDETALTVNYNDIEIEFTPYQIITLRLIPKDA